MSDKKSVILDTAEHLFAMHGYDGTTTRMIADTAGVNIALLSYYFGSKEKLLAAVMDRFIENIQGLLGEEGKDELNPRKLLEQWMSSYVDYVFIHYKPMIIAYREFGLFNERPEIVDKTYSVVYNITEHVMQVFKLGEEKGIFKDFDKELAMITISGTIDSLIFKRRMVTELNNLDVSEDELYPPEFKARVKAYLHNMIEHFFCA